MQATYTKLRDGSWGVRVTGSPVRAGDIVTVTKKDGSSKSETIDKIVWTGDDRYKPGQKMALCVILRGYGGGRRRRGGCNCGDDDCCHPCYCDATCNCKGGNIYNC